MTKRALGLIEVRGYLGAVVAADAAVKAANVSLLNIETVKAGLNTVQLIGDVSAVRAAVDAAVEEVGDKPYYLASHVISRLDDQTNILFQSRQEELTQTTEAVTEHLVQEENETLVTAEEQPSDTVVEIADGAKEKPKYTREELEKLKVVQLRSIAYREEDIDLSKKEIKFANKRSLIEALIKITGKES
ncbi:BMC domain-containing protein [Streptococcus merionis]|uniref:BMC domain-containing protein n=1 Tax=Streptococcus merionis TaxID=400065 RepID=UPI0026F10607|nr:BMC domain-containing protein [Streptococcus merionis]